MARQEAKLETQSNTAIYPSLKDKRVIVSGGGSGIGAGFVEAFAKQGANVSFVDIDREASEALCERLSDAAYQPTYHPCDVTDTQRFIDTIDQMIADLGGCNVLINNAANDQRHAIDTVKPSDWDQSISVNLKHQFFAAQTCGSAMRRCGGGSIINLGSISWHLGMKDLAIYQTAKAAIEGMTRSFARELGPDGIRVNAILPGNVETERQKVWYSPEAEAEIVAAQCVPWRIQPSNVAAMALFLASDDAQMCTGHNYWVDGGWA